MFAYKIEIQQIEKSCMYAVCICRVCLGLFPYNYNIPNAKTILTNFTLSLIHEAYLNFSNINNKP